MTSLPDRQNAVLLIREAQQNGARLEPSCEVMGITVRTWQRWQCEGEVCPDGRPQAVRPTPRNKLSESEREAIVKLCNQQQYRSCPPAFIVADQADQGHYLASESTFYRVLAESGQQHRRGRQQKPSKRSKPTTHRADGPNQLWCWDITWLPGPARGSWFYLYMILDVYSRKMIAHEVYEQENGDNAAELIEKACWRERLSSSDRPLVLHSDNGSPMKAATFLEKLYDLGITPSRGRPRVSNDNAYAESLFKTLKYCPNFPVGGFRNLEQARAWVRDFAEWYNHVHRHEALRYVTPQQRHDGEAERVLQARKKVYEQARQAHPERWPGQIRRFDLPKTVELNPERKEVLLKNSA